MQLQMRKKNTTSVTRTHAVRAVTGLNGIRFGRLVFTFI